MLNRWVSKVTPKRAALGIVGAFLVVTLWSMTSYVVTSDDGGIDQRLAAWARNHHMGVIVDRLERWRYSDPPSTAPANKLNINEGAIVKETTVTTVPEEVVIKPNPITPLVSPGLKGEGEWIPVGVTQSGEVAWATSIRPLPDHASVVATFVVIDQEKLEAGLYNGTELPGGSGWVNGSHVQKEALPSLVVAFNGGFRFEHANSGYFTEGREVQPLKNGEASFAISTSGKVTIGEYGRDLTNDGTWKSIRQNLPLIVDGGVDVVHKNPNINWGVDYHNVLYVLRTAVCQLKNGSIMFTMVGNVDIKMLAQTMLVAGCERAMELDINGTWPQVATYTNYGTSDRQGIEIDNRSQNINRYITQSKKDFFAFFEPSTLPPGIVK